MLDGQNYCPTRLDRGVYILVIRIAGQYDLRSANEREGVIFDASVYEVLTDSGKHDCVAWMYFDRRRNLSNYRPHLHSSITEPSRLSFDACG